MYRLCTIQNRRENSQLKIDRGVTQKIQLPLPSTVSCDISFACSRGSFHIGGSLEHRFIIFTTFAAVEYRVFLKKKKFQNL